VGASAKNDELKTKTTEQKESPFNKKRRGRGEVSIQRSVREAQKKKNHWAAKTAKRNDGKNSTQAPEKKAALQISHQEGTLKSRARQ